VFNSVFKALADPTRREVLAMLRKAGELSAGELAAKFDMTKPTMSHHFAVLKEAELVKSRREGQQIIYSLNTTVMEDVVGLILNLLKRSAASPGDLPGNAGRERST
jgi:DNA-binding transcriptional ArsR family regulator